MLEELITVTPMPTVPTLKEASSAPAVTLDTLAMAPMAHVLILMSALMETVAVRTCVITLTVAMSVSVHLDRSLKT